MVRNASGKDVTVIASRERFSLAVGESKTLDFEGMLGGVTVKRGDIVDYDSWLGNYDNVNLAIKDAEIGDGVSIFLE